MYYTTYLSPMGEIALVANDDGLTALAFQAGKAAIEKDRVSGRPRYPAQP